MFYCAGKVVSDTIPVKLENVPQSFSVHLQASVCRLICRLRCDMQQLPDEDFNVVQLCCFPIVGSNDIMNTLGLQEDGNARDSSCVFPSHVIANLSESIHEAFECLLRTIVAVSDGIRRALIVGKFGRANLL